MTKDSNKRNNSNITTWLWLEINRRCRLVSCSVVLNACIFMSNTEKRTWWRWCYTSTRMAVLYANFSRWRARKKILSFSHQLHLLHNRPHFRIIISFIFTSTESNSNSWHFSQFFRAFFFRTKQNNSTNPKLKLYEVISHVGLGLKYNNPKSNEKCKHIGQIICLLLIPIEEVATTMRMRTIRPVSMLQEMFLSRAYK